MNLETRQIEFDDSIWIDEDFVDGPTRLDCFSEQLLTFHHKTLFGLTIDLVRREAAKTLNPVVSEPETGIAQTSAPLAVSTSLVNAAGSLTARSARILRST